MVNDFHLSNLFLMTFLRIPLTAIATLPFCVRHNTVQSTGFRHWSNFNFVMLLTIKCDQNQQKEKKGPKIGQADSLPLYSHSFFAVCIPKLSVFFCLLLHCLLLTWQLCCNWCKDLQPLLLQLVLLIERSIAPGGDLYSPLPPYSASCLFVESVEVRAYKQTNSSTAPLWFALSTTAVSLFAICLNSHPLANRPQVLYKDHIYWPDNTPTGTN